ncbi:unnamed protein product, partial [Iphiclides podalirius]
MVVLVMRMIDADYVDPLGQFIPTTLSYPSMSCARAPVSSLGAEASLTSDPRPRSRHVLPPLIGRSKANSQRFVTASVLFLGAGFQAERGFDRIVST